MTYSPECVEGGFSEVDNTPNQAGPPEDRQPLSAGDVARFLQRRLWVLILAPLAIAGTAVAFSLLRTPTYEASATVLVGQQQGQDDSPARVEELQALIPSAVEIITTRPVAEEATSGLNLAMDPEAVLENLSAQQTIEQSPPSVCTPPTPESFSHEHRYSSPS
jgi:uncharacterized protein involved in exopolysaccharide biosynthesis